MLRSALLTADLALVAAQPSPFDGWASAEMLALIAEARVFRPALAARFVLNRCPARTVIARETAQSLAEHDPPALAAQIGQRVIFADAAHAGQLVFEHDECSSPRARSPRWRPKSKGSRHDRARPQQRFRGAAARCRELDQDVRPSASGSGDRGLYTARLTVDITPGLRGRIKIAAFQRGVTVADMLRDLLAREFPDTDGGRS